MQYADFHGRDAKSSQQQKITAHDQNHGKNHSDW